MGKTKGLLICAFFVFFLAGCAYAARYYGIEWHEKTEDVILFPPSGSEAKHDEPFTKCKPEPGEMGKCVVQFRADFFELLRQNEELKIRVAELERRCGNPNP